MRRGAGGVARQRRGALSCRPVREKSMATLTETARGEVTLRGEVLRYLRVRPGDNVTLDLLPDGRAELKAERHKHSWHDMAGFLEGKTNGAKLSTDEIGEAIAEAGAAAGLGEP